MNPYSAERKLNCSEFELWHWAMQSLDRKQIGTEDWIAYECAHRANAHPSNP